MHAFFKEQSDMRRGTVREDGKIYCRKLYGKEIWLTKEQYEKREEQRKKYVKMCQNLYKKNRKQVRKFGEYDPQKNLYFISISTSGKEVWRSKKFLEKRRENLKKRKKEYNERCKKLETNTYKLFDQHPNDPNLFVINKVGNKCFYGDIKKVEEKKERLRVIRLKRYFKRKKRKQETLNGTERIKRGTINQENNLIFFGYDSIGKQIWLSSEIYNMKRNKELERRRKNRLLKKLKKENEHQH